MGNGNVSKQSLGVWTGQSYESDSKELGPRDMDSRLKNRKSCVSEKRKDYEFLVKDEIGPQNTNVLCLLTWLVTSTRGNGRTAAYNPGRFSAYSHHRFRFASRLLPVSFRFNLGFDDIEKIRPVGRDWVWIVERHNPVFEPLISFRTCSFRPPFAKIFAPKGKVEKIDYVAMMLVFRTIVKLLTPEVREDTFTVRESFL